MKKIRPIKNTWDDRLINYIPKSIKKSVGGSKDSKVLKIVSLFKTNTPKKLCIGEERNSENHEHKTLEILSYQKKKKIKDRIIRDIWTLFETEEGKEERKKLERNENIMKY